MLRCQECDSTRFRDSEGLKFCVDCGTQSQDYVEEQLDEEAFFASQGFTQHKIRTKTPVKTEEKAPEEVIDVEAVVYDVVQALLKKQLAIATSTLGLPCELKDIVRDLWLGWMCLGTSNKLPEDSSDECSSENESASGSDSDSSRQVQPSRSAGKPYNNREHSKATLPSRPSVYMTLPILYLGCMFAGTGTAAYEVVLWVKSGVLPYFAEGQKHPLATKLPARPKTRVLPQTFPEAEWIYRTSVVMAHMMGLAVPPANAHVLIPKVVERLLFPEPVKGLSAAVMAKSKLRVVVGNRYHRPSSKQRAALHRRVALPELLYAAAAVVALKLKYGIGDAVRTEASEVDGYSWNTWVRQIGEEIAKDSHDSIPRSKSELRAMKEQQKYISFLGQLFPNRLPPSVESVTGLFERVAESFRSTNENEEAASEGGRGGTPTLSGDGEAQARSWVDYSSSGHAETGSVERRATRGTRSARVTSRSPYPAVPRIIPSVHDTTAAMSNEAAYQQTLKSWVQIPDVKLGRARYLRSETSQMLPVNISKKEREEMTHKITYDVLSRIAMLARSKGLRDFDYATTVEEHGRLEVEAAESLVSELPPYKRYVQYKLQGLNTLSSQQETDFHNAYHFLLSVCATRLGCQPSNLAKAVALLELYVFGQK